MNLIEEIVSESADKESTADPIPDPQAAQRRATPGRERWRPRRY
jgi:hypothetical protein